MRESSPSHDGSCRMVPTGSRRNNGPVDRQIHRAVAESRLLPISIIASEPLESQESASQQTSDAVPGPRRQAKFSPADTDMGPPCVCPVCDRITTARKFGLVWCNACACGFHDPEFVQPRQVIIRQQGPDPSKPSPWTGLGNPITPCAKIGGGRNG